MLKVILTDDEQLSREVMAISLEGLIGIDVVQCSGGEEALRRLAEEDISLVLSDIKMPGMNGLELLRRIKSMPNGDGVKVVLFTGYAELESAIAALREGAHDYLLKPVDLNSLAKIIYEHIKELKHEDTDSVSGGPEPDAASIVLEKGAYFNLCNEQKIGVFSPAMKNVVSITLKLHRDRSVPALIEGESGTGKELVAQMIHHGQECSDQPLVSINCSAISPTLFESELFGYAGGTFTGAKEKGMPGKLEIAHGGTIFLDEVGEMPLEMQPKFLRFLQERSFYRVGGVDKIDLDVRIIAATNRNLEDLVEKGDFRNDLYHRLNPGWIHLPPLRDQTEAILPLAQMFLDEFARRRERNFRTISPQAARLLESFDWPGNIRQLRNTIDRITLLYNEIELRESHLAFLAKNTGKRMNLDTVNYGEVSFTLPEDKLDIKELELEIVDSALRKFGGNKTRAASYLGLTLSALRSRMK
ncbi:MAG: sigma-54-dependent transcriptional regulator [Candidatus Kapaibacterium sp.]